MSNRKSPISYRLAQWPLTLDDLELSWFKVIEVKGQIFQKTVTDTMLESIEVK